MFRNLAMVLFILPKLVIWPLIYYWRCRRKRCIEEQRLQEEVSIYPDSKTIA